LALLGEHRMGDWEVPFGAVGVGSNTIPERNMHARREVNSY